MVAHIDGNHLIPIRQSPADPPEVAQRTEHSMHQYYRLPAALTDIVQFHDAGLPVMRIGLQVTAEPYGEPVLSIDTTQTEVLQLKVVIEAVAGSLPSLAGVFDATKRCHFV